MEKVSKTVISKSGLQTDDESLKILLSPSICKNLPMTNRQLLELKKKVNELSKYLQKLFPEDPFFGGEMDFNGFWEHDSSITVYSTNFSIKFKFEFSVAHDD